MKIKLLQTVLLAFICFAGTSLAQQLVSSVPVESISSEHVSLKVFPNPTTSTFSLTHDQDIKFITLFNIVGKEICKFSHHENKIHNIADFRNGIYIVRLYDENRDVVKVLRLHKK